MLGARARWRGPTRARRARRPCAGAAPTGKDIKPRDFVKTAYESIARDAYELELKGMTKYGHTIITPGKHGAEKYARALQESEQGRAIFSCKRKDMHGDQQFKARCVKQGFRSPSEPGTNIYSPVVRGDEFRATVLRPNRNAAHPGGPRRIATLDNCKAYILRIRH